MMTKKIKLLALSLLILNACATHAPIKTEAPKPSPSAPIETKASAPSLKPYIKIAVSPYATEAEKKLILEAEKIVNAVVLSPCFDDQFLTVDGLNETKDTPEQVRHKVKKSHVEMEARFYSKRFTKAVAYREGDSMYFNRSKTFGWGACDYASTMLHESTHNLGYGHAFNDYLGRELTAPYFMNTIMERCCAGVKK